MGKYLKQGYVRNLEWELGKENISYSKMVDMMEEECIKNYKKDNTMIKKVKRFFKEIWLGIKISNENYLNGKTNQGKC